MAKFNKDTFLNEITTKVQNAIDKNLISKEDIDRNDTERLHGFIQYELLECIENRKFAIDVLKDFNYDEKTPWDVLQEKFGIFKSLMDIALVNLWKFLEAEGATEYHYYKFNNISGDDKMLDAMHKIEANATSDEDTPMDDNEFEDFDVEPDPDFDADEPEEPRRKIRLADEDYD